MDDNYSTRLDNYWNQLFSELKKFKEKNQHTNVPYYFPTNKKLGLWVAYQRVLYKTKDLSKERINLLESIGFQWNHDFNDTVIISCQTT